jgi:acyl-CoA thioester hydrolase
MAFVLDPHSAVTTSHVRVRFCDTDLMGIVHHANYFAYFEAGRVEWLRKRGVSYTTWAARGMHLPVVDASIRYRAPARFDDVLEVATTLSELKAASLRFEYRLHRAETDGPLLIAEGMTRLAFVDEKHGVRRFTDEVLAVLTSAESEKSPDGARVE